MQLRSLKADMYMLRKHVENKTGEQECQTRKVKAQDLGYVARERERERESDDRRTCYKGSAGLPPIHPSPASSRLTMPVKRAVVVGPKKPARSSLASSSGKAAVS